MWLPYQFIGDVETLFAWAPKQHENLPIKRKKIVDYGVNCQVVVLICIIYE